MLRSAECGSCGKEYLLDGPRLCIECHPLVKELREKLNEVHDLAYDKGYDDGYKDANKLNLERF